MSSQGAALRGQNKNTDFFMILACLFRFKIDQVLTNKIVISQLYQFRIHHDDVTGIVLYQGDSLCDVTRLKAIFAHLVRLHFKWHVPLTGSKSKKNIGFMKSGGL